MVGLLAKDIDTANDVYDDYYDDYYGDTIGNDIEDGEEGGSGTGGYSEPSDDTLNGGGIGGGSEPSDDTLNGGGTGGGSEPSDDTLHGGGTGGGSEPSDDTLHGGGIGGGSEPSDDTLHGGGTGGGSEPSDDTLHGGGTGGSSEPSDDTLHGGGTGGSSEPSEDTLNGASGTPGIYEYGGLWNDIFIGTADDDTLYGNGGNDILNGLAGMNIVSGGDGNDVLFYHLGDYLSGGSGTDTLTARNATSGVAISAQQYSDIEVFTGGVYSDVLLADSGDQRLYDGDAWDAGFGVQPSWWGGAMGSANDVLIGGSGHDSLYATNGNDLLVAGEGDGFLSGGNDNDFLIGGFGNDTLVGGFGCDVLLGFNGNNLLNGDAGDDILLGGNGNDTLLGGAGCDVLMGFDGNNVLVGGSGNDILIGGSGNDTLDGSLGSSDTLLGGTGNDVYIVNRTGHNIVSDSGGENDVLILFGANDFRSYDYTRSGNDLVIDNDHTLANGVVVRIENWFNGNDNQLEEIEFGTPGTANSQGLDPHSLNKQQLNWLVDNTFDEHAESGFVRLTDINGTNGRNLTMHYDKRGTGPETVVMVHGNLMTSGSWKTTIDQLDLTKYTVYAVDIDGCGFTMENSTGETGVLNAANIDNDNYRHAIPQYAEDLKAFVDTMGLTDFHLVGHSLGGAISMQYYLDNRSNNKVRDITLLDSVAAEGFTMDDATHATHESWAGNRFGTGGALSALMGTAGYFSNDWTQFYPTADFTDPQVVNAFTEGASLTSNDCFNNNAWDCRVWNIQNQMSNVLVPVEVIHGAHDYVIAGDATDRMYAGMTNSADRQFVSWADRSHCGNIEDPVTTASTFSSFWNRHGR